MHLRQIGRFILDRQALFGRLHMRVACAAPPDVTARIAGLGLHLGIELAGTLARHCDPDAGLPLESGNHVAAPLHRAIEHEVAFGRGALCP
jgi:hypothetical protein